MKDKQPALYTEGQTLGQLGFCYKTETEWDALNVQLEENITTPRSTT